MRGKLEAGSSWTYSAFDNKSIRVDDSYVLQTRRKHTSLYQRELNLSHPCKGEMASRDLVSGGTWPLSQDELFEHGARGFSRSFSSIWTFILSETGLAGDLDWTSLYLSIAVQ